jgi:two-component system cell cycle sensor histidine kinase/response regulator CckA
MIEEANGLFIALLGQPDKNELSLFACIDEKYHQDLLSLLNNLSGESSEQSPSSVAVTLKAEPPIKVSLYCRPIEHGSGYMLCALNHSEAHELELRYVHSQKMQAVGQLAGGIAHDFNNLLTAILGFCDLLLIRHPAGDASFADIMQIKQNSNRAANLVRQLLAFSRRQTLQPEILDVADVLSELSHLIERLIGDHVTLNIQHGRNLHPIKVDQGQLEQVIINLAVNARDAMSEGGQLTIRTHAVTLKNSRPLSPRDISPDADDPITPGQYTVIEVQDSGSGIPDDVIGSIFEPFYSTKNLGEGTGLGLATVHGIVKQTGGHLFVNSTVGTGTVFRLLFPITEAEQKPLKKDNSSPEPIPHGGDLTGHATILLVEDEAPVRAFSSRALGNKGYEVLEADSGEAALEVMENTESNIDLIITDVMMPGMGGPELIRHLIQQQPSIKVIFISGFTDQAFIEEFSDYDCHFLPKPYSLKQLASKVKDVLSQHHRSAA